MDKLVIPAAIATAAGIGLDLMANMLSSYWPDAPHLLFGLLFWSGFFLACVPLPAWATVKLFRAGRRMSGAATAFACVILLSVIASFFAIPMEIFHSDEFDNSMPGLTFYAVLRIFDTPEFTRKYIFNAATPDGAPLRLGEFGLAKAFTNKEINATIENIRSRYKLPFN